MQVVQRAVAEIVVDALGQRGRVLVREVLHLHERLARVDQDPRGLVGRHVAQHALREVQVLVQQRRRRRFARTHGQVAPQLGQVLDVRLHLALGRRLRHRADDEAAGEAFGQQMLQPLAQRLALRLVADALRDADVRVLRQIDEQAAGEADLRGKARALGADRILDHLHEQRLALVQDLLDRLLLAAVAVLPMLPDVGDVQERRALEADLDERALHARQHARHAAEVDVADEPARARTLDVQFLHHALLEHGDTRFLRRDVDQDFMGHGGRMPAARSHDAPAWRRVEIGGSLAEGYSTARPIAREVRRFRPAAVPSRRNNCLRGA